MKTYTTVILIVLTFFAHGCKKSECCVIVETHVDVWYTVDGKDMFHPENGCYSAEDMRVEYFSSDQWRIAGDSEQVLVYHNPILDAYLVRIFTEVSSPKIRVQVGNESSDVLETKFKQTSNTLVLSEVVVDGQRKWGLESPNQNEFGDIRAFSIDKSK